MSANQLAEPLQRRQQVRDDVIARDVRRHLRHCSPAAISRSYRDTGVPCSVVGRVL